MGLFGAVISKMEVRKMQRRMRSSHRARANQGTPAGGTRPLGWRDDRLALEPGEAALLRRAAEEFTAGRSLNSIVNEWQRPGIVTSLGNRWTTTSLRLTLSNARLCGWRELNRELMRDTDGNPVAGQWEPILTPDEWLAVRVIFDGRKGRRFYPDGTVGEILPPEHREPHHSDTHSLNPPNAAARRCSRRRWRPLALPDCLTSPDVRRIGLA